MQMNNYWVTLLTTINNEEWIDQIKVTANSLARASHESTKFVEDNYPDYQRYQITKIEQTDD